MATFLVWSGGNNSSGTEASGWANAYTAFGSAVTAATGDGDIIKVHYTHQEELGADTTYTFANNVRVLSVNKDSSDAPTAMGTGGWIGNSTTNRGVTITGAVKLFLYGLTLRTSGSTSDDIVLTLGADGSDYAYENCYIWSGNTNTATRIICSDTANTSNAFVSLRDCTLRFGSTSQSLQVRNVKLTIDGGSVSSAGSAPTTLFTYSSRPSPGIDVNGADLSHVTGTLFGDNTVGSSHHTLTNCKLGSGAVIFASQTVTNRGSGSVKLFNCASDDTHYNFGYYDAFGEVTVSTGIYATDAAANNKYDGTNRCSWKVVTTANCSYYTPFVTPWFETYHSGTSAITPSIEVLADRTGSPLKDDEIWGEWSYQGTSGSTQASFVNDRRALAGAAANQANSSLTASDWTGETAGSPTPWFGKLAPASAITPAEIGMLRARVCVGKASTTVYVDPSVRYS